jgi:NAD(P)-dependent dehydrogenase (short-subunit alcohol dehydrogenase family)
MFDPNDEGFSGTVAIVTGAGAAGEGIGNGRAAALLLARAGARVVAVDRQLALAQRTAEMIEAAGGTALAIEANVSVESQCRDMVEQAMARFGRVDFLDNNVGIASKRSVVDEDQATWRRVMEVNVESMFLCAKYAIPAMLAGKRGGAIVNVSSISALRPRGLTAYSASKGAVIALTRAMAVDHGKDGVRVNCIAPGVVYTPMVIATGMSEEARERRRRASLLEIEGSGWDIGNAARFLLSQRARFITGQVLVVDAGTTLMGPPRHTDTN